MATYEIPFFETDWIRVTPGSPVMADSTGNVKYCSISTGDKLGALVKTSTWFGERLVQAKESIPANMGLTRRWAQNNPDSVRYTSSKYDTKSQVAEPGSTDILDWDIAPKLRTVPGIVEVNSQGGELKTYEVQVDFDKLTAYHIRLERVIAALQSNNANAGGAYLDTSSSSRSYAERH